MIRHFFDKNVWDIGDYDSSRGSGFDVDHVHANAADTDNHTMIEFAD